MAYRYQIPISNPIEISYCSVLSLLVVYAQIYDIRGEPEIEDIFDYIVIGSGFGGSVSALRLSEKGYRVLVLEEGKWYEDKDFPKTNNNPFRYYWKPGLFCRGYQRIHFFKHTAILGGSGVGGGSLIYGNTLLEPPDVFFQSCEFPREIQWKKELEPFYKTASYMMGKVRNEIRTTMDDVLSETAIEFNAKGEPYPVDVAVYFGEPDMTVPDPYFGGRGPDRTGCTLCAGCMNGCRVGAKNLLLKNYLYFALKEGAQIIPERRVVDIIQENGIYKVVTESSTSFLFKKRKTFNAKGIILSAGVIGTLKLLFIMKNRNRLKISEKLGHNVRNNSESLIGVRKPTRKTNFAEGLAITSGVFIDDETNIEVVRYAAGSNGMSLISTLLTDKEKGIFRWISLLKNIVRQPLKFFRALNPIGWARQSIILLVMQTRDNRIRMYAVKKLFGRIKLKTAPEDGQERVPVYIPKAHNFVRLMAKKIDAIPLSCIYEVFFDSPLTAHILGGCAISKTEKEGVVDIEQKLHGYDNFYIIDASVIPANLGVNPAFTILAMSERAMSRIPFKDGKKRKQIGLN